MATSALLRLSILSLLAIALLLPSTIPPASAQLYPCTYAYSYYPSAFCSAGSSYGIYPSVYLGGYTATIGYPTALSCYYTGGYCPYISSSESNCYLSGACPSTWTYYTSPNTNTGTNWWSSYPYWYVSSYYYPGQYNRYPYSYWHPYY